MASYKFLLDNCVRHLASVFPDSQTLQLEHVDLKANDSDADIVAVASENKYIIVTNNRRHFEHEVVERIAESSKKQFGCTQVHGLIIVLPVDQLKQERAIRRASKQLSYDGEAITWKDVNERCLKVIVEESGKAIVSKLPRCPHCNFHDE
jgi:hypothetical protein